MTPLVATVRSAFAEAWANRAAFWTQFIALVLNDIVWIIFWVLFFRRVGEVRGWDTDAVLMLLAVLCTSAGITLGFLANARRIGVLAADGQLDAVLALPVSPLSFLLVRRIETTHLGDLAFGLVLFAVIGSPTPDRVATFVVGVLASVGVMTGFLVLTGSLAFFLGRGEAGEMGFHAILLMASYPVDVFTGAAKVLLYTVVPAAFVAAAPAQLIEDADAGDAALLLLAAAVFSVAGWAAFTAGLRRYTSGAIWTRA